MDKVIWILYAQIYFVNTGVSLIAPFFPPLAFQRGGTYFLVGLAYSICALVAFFTTFAYGKLMKYIGKRNLIIFGSVIQTISINSFGLLWQVESKWMFFGLSFLLKTLQGAGGAAINLATFSFIPMLYPKCIDKRMQELQAFDGLGFITGPLFGTVLQQWGGYQLPFYVMGNVVFILIIPALKVLPSKANETSEQHEKTVEQKKILSKSKVVAFFAMNIIIVSSFTMCASFISQQLKDEYKFTQNYINYFFNLLGAQQIFTILLVDLINLKPIMRKVIIFATIVNGISMIFIGPDELITDLFKTKESLIFTIISPGIAAFGQCIVLVLAVQQLIHLFNRQKDLDDINKGDGASILFNSAWHFSEFFGPVIGGQISDNYGLKRTAAAIGVVTVIYSIIFIFISREPNLEKAEESLRISRGEEESKNPSQSNEDQALLQNIKENLITEKESKE